MYCEKDQSPNILNDQTENISQTKTIKSTMQKILDSRAPSLSDAKFKRRVSLISNKLI